MAERDKLDERVTNHLDNQHILRDMDAVIHDPKSSTVKKMMAQGFSYAVQGIESGQQFINRIEDGVSQPGGVKSFLGMKPASPQPANDHQFRESVTDVVEKIVVAGRTAMGDKNAAEYAARLRREGRMEPPSAAEFMNPFAPFSKDSKRYMFGPSSKDSQRPSLNLDQTQPPPPSNSSPTQNQQQQAGGH